MAGNLGTDTLALEERDQERLAEQPPARLLHERVGSLEPDTLRRPELESDHPLPRTPLTTS